MTDSLLRAANELQLVKRWMTPFLRLSNACPRTKHLEAFYAPFRAEGVPVTVQLMGVDAPIIAEAAKAFVDLGAAGINLNFGCPSRQVTSGGAGAGALRNPPRMAELAKVVKEAIPDTPLSIKLRTGWESPEEMETILPLLAETGAVSQFFLHYRTAREQYLPAEGRLERLKRGVELVAPLPLVVNGDLETAAGMAELVHETGAAGAMAARGWLRDPDLFRRAAGEESPADGRERFFEAVLSHGLIVAKAIELSIFLWGKGNPVFERLKTLPRHQSAQ